MLELRQYQKDIIAKGTEVIRDYGFLYLAMEVRTGKTLTSLGICEQLNVDNVLFLTKKKAIGSISDDYTKMCPANFTLFTINYELIQRHDPKVILLSGTPTPESYSQMYHQVYGLPMNPFNRHTTFYKFAHDWVNVKQKKINGNLINDYSGGRKDITKAMERFTINFSQKQAGFEVVTKEHVLRVRLRDETYRLAKRLDKDLVVEGKDEVILADTPVKLMSKLHQIYSGTIKFESGKSMVIDHTKAEFILDRFKGQKIGIFYKFKEELTALKDTFGKELLTTELEEFETTDKSIALQIVSGREGISLRQADALVYYNIDFSATSYWQSRDRMTTKDRLKSDVYWVFSEGGIEDDIYKAVSKKKTYTVNYFKKDFVHLYG